MSKRKSNTWWAMMPTLLLPLVIGMALYFVLIGAINRQLIHHDLLTRYITGHPVSLVTTAMFLVGLAAVMLVASELFDQFRTLNQISFRSSRGRDRNKGSKSAGERGVTPLVQWFRAVKRSVGGLNREEVGDTSDATDASDTAGVSADPSDRATGSAEAVGESRGESGFARRTLVVHTEQATPESEGQREVNTGGGAADLDQQVDKLETRLSNLPRRMHSFYLWKRLSAALQYVRRHRSAAGLDDELKYLADVDADYKHQRYSLVRILIWATPMLGFLGTVLGISEALGGLAIGPDNDFQSMMAGLRSSLYVAFDTTALALTFSIILMFIQFIADRFETQLLESVDQRSKAELNQQFSLTSDSQDDYVRSLEKMSDQMISNSGKLVEQQCELWSQSIESAQQAWIESLDAAKSAAQSELQKALQNATKSLSDQVSESIDKVDRTLECRIHQWQVALSDLTRTISDQQEQMVTHTNAIIDVASQFEKLGQIQSQLTQYLEALPDGGAVAEELNQAADKLATAIQILEHRSNESPYEWTAQRQEIDGRHLETVPPHELRAA